ncbi:hypothetical protein D9M71_110290 [compost metagenome]
MAQQLALQLTHREGVVDHQDALAHRFCDLPRALIDALQATGAQKLLHRAEHVFDIDDQDHRTIVEQGAGSNVLDLAKTSIEGQNHQGSLTDKALHGKPVDVVALANDHHSHTLAYLLADRPVQHLAGRDQPDMATFEPEVLTPFDLDDVGCRQIDRALDVRQRKAIGLAADFDHQATHHRQRQRHFQVKSAALPCHLLQRDRTAQLPDHVLDCIEPDPAAGHLRDRVTQAEAGQE